MQRGCVDITMPTLQTSQEQGWKRSFTTPTTTHGSKQELEGRLRPFSSLPASQWILISVTVTELGRGNKEMANTPKSHHSVSLWFQASYLLHSRGLLCALDWHSISTAIAIKIVLQGVTWLLWLSLTPNKTMVTGSPFSHGHPSHRCPWCWWCRWHQIYIWLSSLCKSFALKTSSSVSPLKTPNPSRWSFLGLWCL